MLEFSFEMRIQSPFFFPPYPTQGPAARGPGGVKSVKAEQNKWVKLISILQKKELLPCIVFSFSKRKCEEAADLLGSQDLLPNAVDKGEVHVFMDKSFSRLKGSDRNLPQVSFQL